jgi:hypothetical protein
MTDSAPEAPSEAQRARCTATNKRGQPCASFAVQDGLCSVHAGLVDPRANGQRGGLRKKGEKGREDTRRKAKARLSELVNHPDPRLALRAAQSLYSVSPERPTDGDYADDVAEIRHENRLTMDDIFEVLLEGLFSGTGSARGVVQNYVDAKTLARIRAAVAGPQAS